jgi:hypothetical protein
MPLTKARGGAARNGHRLGEMSEPAGYDEELLPEQTTDDTDRGWGEHPDRDDDERIARERPPHYGG